MYSIHQLPGRTAHIDGEEWLYFSGTAYLGVVCDERFQALVKEGIDRYGVHYGGSRLAGIHLPVFEQAEETLCRLTGAPAALIVSSGTLAGQLAVRVLGQNSACSFAPRVHPALWPEGYMPFAGTYEEWVSSLKRAAPKNRDGQPPQKHGNKEPRKPQNHTLLLINSLDSLHARPYDFAWLQDCLPDHPITVIVDDSHGLGVMGPEGAGIYPQLNAPSNVDVVVISSLGKALGIPGGVILGPAAAVERIRQSPYFGGASPTPPAYLHALVEGQHLYADNRMRLRQRVRQFRKAVDGSGLFRSFGEYPVFYTPDQQLADFLAARRVLVSNFSYPTPDDPRVTRVVINALHTEADIAVLAEQINEYFLHSPLFAGL